MSTDGRRGAVMPTHPPLHSAFVNAGINLMDKTAIAASHAVGSTFVLDGDGLNPIGPAVISSLVTWVGAHLRAATASAC